jgi:hypothetical protein
MKEKIEHALNEALDTLLKRDAHILKADVNERTISHHLAGYFEPYFDGWNIDCEYNRDQHAAKRLEISRRDVPNDDTQARTVFPDIIVHKRNTNEINKTTSREKDDFDLCKLDAFKKQLGYRFAVFVKVRTDAEPAIETINWV